MTPEITLTDQQWEETLRPLLHHLRIQTGELRVGLSATRKIANHIRKEGLVADLDDIDKMLSEWQDRLP